MAWSISCGGRLCHNRKREEGKGVGSAGTAGHEPAVMPLESFRDELDAQTARAQGASSDSDPGLGDDGGIKQTRTKRKHSDTHNES